MAQANEKINRRPLTRVQLDHAERRLREALQRQQYALNQKYPEPERPKTQRFTNEQFYRAVATGKVKLRPLADIPKGQHYVTPLDSLRDAFLVPADMAKKKTYDAACKVRGEAMAKANKQIEIRFNNALDALYLSDAEKALQIVEQFAEGK